MNKCDYCGEPWWACECGITESYLSAVIEETITREATERIIRKLATELKEARKHIRQSETIGDGVGFKRHEETEGQAERHQEQPER